MCPTLYHINKIEVISMGDLIGTFYKSIIKNYYILMVIVIVPYVTRDYIRGPLG